MENNSLPRKSRGKIYVHPTSRVVGSLDYAMYHLESSAAPCIVIMLDNISCDIGHTPVLGTSTDHLVNFSSKRTTIRAELTRNSALILLTTNNSVAQMGCLSPNNTVESGLGVSRSMAKRNLSFKAVRGHTSSERLSLLMCLT